MHRQHPIKIVTLMSKNFWLLVIPLVRGLITSQLDFATIYYWLKGAWLDILVILFIVVSAYVRWRCTTFSITRDKLICNSGVFVKHRNEINLNKLTAVTGEKKFLLRPFRAVNLYFDNDAGRSVKKSAVTLTVRYDDYKKIFRNLSKKKDGGIKASYCPKRTHLVFFSIVFSSTLSGVIFLSTLFIQSGKILGESVERGFFHTVDDVASKLDSIVNGIPKIAVGVSLVLLAGWLFSIIRNLLRYVGFRIERANSTVSIRAGFFTKRHYSIDTDRIFSVDLKQNILMKFFSVTSVQVDCAGYGRTGTEIPVFIPITTKKQVISSMKLLLPKMNVTQPDIRPKSNSFFRYICAPFFIMLGLIPAAWILVKIFPLWNSFIWFMAIMLEIPTLIFLAAKVAAFFTTGISVKGDTVCIKYSLGTRFHTIVVPKENLVKISVTQSIFQILTKACNVTFHTKNKLMNFHFVLALPVDETAKYLNETGLCGEILRFSQEK